MKASEVLLKVSKEFIICSFVLIGLFSTLSFGIVALLIHYSNSPRFNAMVLILFFIFFFFLINLLIIFCYYAKTYYDESKKLLNKEPEVSSDERIKKLETKLEALENKVNKIEKDQETEKEETRFKMIDKLNELFISVIKIDPKSENAEVIKALKGISDEMLKHFSETMSGEKEK